VGRRLLTGILELILGFWASQQFFPARPALILIWVGLMALFRGISEIVGVPGSPAARDRHVTSRETSARQRPRAMPRRPSRELRLYPAGRSASSDGAWAAADQEQTQGEAEGRGNRHGDQCEGGPTSERPHGNQEQPSVPAAQ
jgi:hypothetical protein